MSIDPSTLDTAQRGHHPDSPSSLQASEACPLFENEQRDSQASRDGTLQHKAAETRDLSILDGDEAMIEAVKSCIKYEDDVIAAAAKRDGRRPDLYHEVLLAVGDDIVVDSAGKQWIGVTAGFPDTIVAGADEVDILDWKFGKVPVTPTADNLQGKAYALAVLQQNPEIKGVTVHFFAPYQGWPAREHLLRYVHRFSRADMPAMELHIRTVVASKRHPDAKPRPAMDLCIWCAHKGSCGACHSLTLKPASKHLDFVEPGEIDYVRLTTADQVKIAHRWASQVEPILKAIKKRATEMVLTENLELGEDFKLVKKQVRSVRNQKALYEAAKEFGMTDDELWSLMGLPISIVEKKIKEKAPKGEGAAKLREFAARLSDDGITELGSPIFFLQEVKAPAEKSKPILELVADDKPAGTSWEQ